MTSLAGLKSHDSILSKLDTFKRKKRERLEVEELTKESHQAIQIATSSFTPYDPKDYQLQEGEERSFVEKSSENSAGVQDLVEKLISWINNELADQRIIVRDLQEDLYDGQILQKLVEKLANLRLDHPELTQTELGQLQRLRKVISVINELLHASTWASQRWTAELIHQKDLIAILRLLVALAQFKPGIHFPPGIFLTVIIARKLNGVLEYRYASEYVTDVSGPEPAGHPLDVLSEHHMVLQTLLQFVNAYLEQLSLKVTDLSNDFSDGVFLILLMGMLEGYFVPFYAYNPTPSTEAMRLSNVRLAFELIQDAGLSELPAQPEEIVAADRKAILRVLYSIYSYYRRQLVNNMGELDEVDEGATGSD